MRRLFLLLMIICPMIGYAQTAGAHQVLYIGGTANIPKEIAGTLDTADKALTFRSGNSELVIPYTSIITYRHNEAVRHRLGVVPTIAVVLVKRRDRKHTLTVEYKDSAGGRQAVVFDIPKTLPDVIMPVLQAKTSCKQEERCSEKAPAGPSNAAEKIANTAVPAVPTS